MDIYKFVHDIKNIQVLKNYQTQLTSFSQHTELKKVFALHEIVELPKTTLYTEFVDVSDGIYFIEEPYGTQRAPDFVLIIISNHIIQRDSNGTARILGIELKTGNGKIMWNDGCPEPKYIYVYTDTKLKQTIVFSGNDTTFCSTVTRNNYKNLVSQLKLINVKLRDIANPDGFKFYIRKASSQTINILNYNLLDRVNISKFIIIDIIKFIGIGF